VGSQQVEIDTGQEIQGMRIELDAIEPRTRVHPQQMAPQALTRDKGGRLLDPLATVQPPASLRAKIEDQLVMTIGHDPLLVHR
jgi:hypothetical protein